MELLNINNSKRKSNFNRFKSAVDRYFMIIQYFWFKLIGLSPWTCKFFLKNRKINSVKNKICNYSYFGSLYNILYVIINILIHYLNYIAATIESENNEALSRSIFIILSSFQNLTLLIFIIRQKSMINIIYRLADVDEKLEKWNDNETECDYHIYLTFILNFFVFGSLEISQMQQYPLITILDQVFDSFSSSGVIMQYTMFLNMITKRFEMINTTIAEFYTMKIRTDRAQTSYVIETSVIPESTFYSMDIFHAYIELCDLCDSLNNIYGLPILVTILFLCAEGIFLLYFIILVLISFVSVSEGTYLSLILVSRAIFLVMVLTSNVTKTMDEVELYLI